MGCTNSCGPHSSIEPKEIMRSKIKDFKVRRKSYDVIDKITEKVQIFSAELNDQQLTYAVDVLINHPFFVSLNKSELKTICSQMVHAKAKAKQYIFKQGDIGNCFFVIKSGTVDVQIDGKHVRTLSERETFGQMALLFHCHRTASIKCREEICSVLLMKPKLYKSTLYKMKMEENSRNMQTINNVPIFSCLTNKQKAAISDTIKIVVFSESDVVFRAGDDAQAIYIISEGHLKIGITGKKDITLKAGDIFGEAAIQPNMKRFGSAIATSKLICSMISRKDIQMTLGSSINNLIYYNIKKWVLIRSKTFEIFSQIDINALITQFQPFSVQDSTIIDQNKYKGLIICLQGTINNNLQGKLFNEENLINKSFKCERLVKNGDGQCCFIPFTKVEKIIKKINPKKELKKLDRRRSNNRKQKFNLSDFRFIKKLGEGQFGQVFLVKNIQFGTNLYALKCLSKQLIRKQQIQDSVIQQRKILEKSLFPYIVGYVKSFHDDENIFILMEYIHGKEMFDTIRQVKHMSLEMVKYYFACLILSIQYLHDNNIIYRDVKPQNSVVDYNGKCYLIDLGTAKQLTAQNCFKTFTIIGTPHYMAPQVFQGKGYSFQADIWSLGCLLYEFLCYTLPFGQNVNDPYEIYTIIKNHSLSFPKFVKDNKAIKLISNLLEKSPKQRGSNTFDKIKKSEFYKNFDWTGLMEQSMKGPYIPKQFEHNPLSALQKAQSQDFLQYFYQSDKHFQIEEWNSNF